MVSRGMTIRQNNTIRLTSTTMLKGFLSTFRIRFLIRRAVSFFLGGFSLVTVTAFDTITPLSDNCQELPRRSSPPNPVTPRVVHAGRKCVHFAQTFATSCVHYKESKVGLSIVSLPILRGVFCLFSRFVYNLDKESWRVFAILSIEIFSIF